MKKIISFVLIAMLFLNINVYSDEEKTAYVLIEQETGTVLKSENQDIILPIGSLTKLMTQLIVAENIENGKFNLETLLTASEKVFGMKGASIWLSAGEKMSVEDLLKASIIGNANDATAALAEGVSGTQEKFVELMNKRAAELDMKNTNFKDCVGLAESFSTAYDMSLLSRELSKHKILTPYMTTWRDFIRGDSTELVNENTAVKSLDGITGLKAGRSGETFNIALSAERNSKTYIAVVLNCKDKDERFTLAKELVKSGFNNYTVTEPFFSAEFLKPLTVKKGVQNAVELEPYEIKSVLVNRGKADEITAQIFLPLYIEAPVKQGQKVGTVAFYINDTLLYETPLITKSDIEIFTCKKAFAQLLKSLLS
jgi:D-alanyl-D-alanine carboxypeptidase (penicillin-binding protein 5/6)